MGRLKGLVSGQNETALGSCLNNSQFLTLRAVFIRGVTEDIYSKGQAEFLNDPDGPVQPPNALKGLGDDEKVKVTVLQRLPTCSGPERQHELRFERLHDFGKIVKPKLL
jgi:hypothetical protein